MKNRIKQHALAAASLAIFTSASQAAVLAQYQLENTGASALQSIAVTSTTTNVTAGSFTGVVGTGSTGTGIANIGISAADNAYLRATNTQNTQALALTDLSTGTRDYFEFTISANVGYTLDLSDLSFAIGENTAASTPVLSSNVLGYGTAISGTPASYNLSAAAYNNLSTITFRLTQFDSVNTSVLTRYDDVTLNGAVVPESSTALLGCLGMLALLRRRR